MGVLNNTDKYIYSLLNGDDTTKNYQVYNSSAPPNAALPYIVFNVQSPGNDIYVAGGIRIMTDPLYAVKAVSNDNYQTSDTIYALIDTLLKDSSKYTSGILSCIRESPLRFIDKSDTTTYYHSGGLYRITAQD